VPQIRNIVLEKTCNRGITTKTTQGHWNCSYTIGRTTAYIMVA